MNAIKNKDEWVNLIKGIFDLVLPRECVVCSSVIKDSQNGFVCSECFSKIKIIEPPFCKGCGRPFISRETLKYSPEHLCARCREKAFSFHCARAVGVYEGTLKKLIHAYKFRKKRALGEYLSKIMIENLGDKFEQIDFDTIIPVPLHKQRLRTREFDQSFLLAMKIGKHLNIPVLSDSLIRYRSTKPQLELKVKERLKNVKGAFRVREGEKIKGKSILLIDDVFTTGATINECSKILKKEGASRVDAFVLSMIC